MQVSVQIGLNWYWTGTELGNLENVQTQSFAYQAGGNFLGKQKYIHNSEIPFCKIIF